MRIWLAVERVFNLNIDAVHKYQSFGLTERKRNLASQVEKGDYVIFYISAPVSAIVHVRVVTDTGVYKNSIDYDDLFPIMIKTTTLRILTEAQYVKFNYLGIHKAVLQNAFRMLSEEEGKRLYDLVKAAQQLEDENNTCQNQAVRQKNGVWMYGEYFIKKRKDRCWIVNYANGTQVRYIPKSTTIDIAIRRIEKYIQWMKHPIPRPKLEFN